MSYGRSSTPSARATRFPGPLFPMHFLSYLRRAIKTKRSPLLACCLFLLLTSRPARWLVCCTCCTCATAKIRASQAERRFSEGKCASPLRNVGKWHLLDVWGTKELSSSFRCFGCHFGDGPVYNRAFFCLGSLKVQGRLIYGLSLTVAILQLDAECRMHYIFIFYHRHKIPAVWLL